MNRCQLRSWWNQSWVIKQNWNFSLTQLQPCTTKTRSQFSCSTWGHFTHLHCISRGSFTTSSSWLTQKCIWITTDIFLKIINEGILHLPDMTQTLKEKNVACGSSFTLTVHTTYIPVEFCNIPEDHTTARTLFTCTIVYKRVVKFNCISLSSVFSRGHVPACTCCRQIPFNHLAYASPSANKDYMFPSSEWTERTWIIT